MISTKTICSRVAEALSKGGYTVNVRLLKRTRNNKDVIYVAVDCPDGFGKFFDLEAFSKVQEAQDYIVSQFIEEHKNYNSELNPEIVLKNLYPVLTYENDSDNFQGTWEDFKVNFHYTINNTTYSLKKAFKKRLKLTPKDLVTIALNNSVNNIAIYNNKSLLEKTIGNELAELLTSTNLGLQNTDVCFLHSDFCNDISGIFLVPDVFKVIAKKKLSDLMIFRLENNFLLIMPIKALETEFGNRRTSKFKNRIIALNEIINEQHTKKEPLSNVFVYRTKQNVVEVF